MSHQEEKQIPPPSAPSRLQKVVPFVKTSLVFLAFVIVSSYFGVFQAVIDPSSALPKRPLVLSIAAVIAGTAVYLSNYCRFVVRRRVSQRITPERWYTVAPGSVAVTVIAYAAGFLLFFFAMWRCYGFLLGLLLAVLTLFTAHDLISHAPF